MAASNATIMAKILADNADLTKKLADSERKVKGFERAAARAKKNTKNTFAPLAQSAQNVGGPLSKMVGGLGLAQGALGALRSPAGAAAVAVGGVALAAKGLEDAVQATVSLAKQTNKLKRETGLSAETASAYIAIADRFGISTSKLSTQFGALSKKIRAANSGTKGAATAMAQFADAGVSAATLRSGDLNRILLEVADTFKALPDSADKTGLAMQLFGKSGKDLLPMLNKGRDGIAELQAKMTALGLTLSQDTIEQTKQYGAAQKTLSQSLKGLQVQIGAKVLPVVARFAEGLQDAIVSLRTGKKPTTEMGAQLKQFALEAKKVYDQVKRVTLQIVTFGKKHPQLVRIVTALVALKVAAKLISFALPIKSTIRFLGVLGKLAKTKAGQTAVSRISSAFTGLWGRTKGTLGRFGKSVGTSLGNAGRSAASKLTGSISGSVSASMNSGRLAGLKGTFTRYGKGLGKAMGKAAGVAAILGIYYALKDSPLGRYSGGKGWKNLWNDIKNKFSSLADWVGQNAPSGFAQGGIVNRRTFAMIGEDGPEAVVPLTKPRRARAVMAQAGLLGGGGGNNYFTINTTGSVDEQALAAKIGWQLASRGIA